MYELLNVNTAKEIRETVNKNTNEVLSIRITNSNTRLLVLTIGININIWEVGYNNIIILIAKIGTVHFKPSKNVLLNLLKCKILQGNIITYFN